MPGLILRALERYVEPDLDDLIARSEDSFAHAMNPRMRHQVHKAAERLRMRFDVPAPRAAPDGAAGTLNRFPERGHHVLAQMLDPVPRERALKRGDAVCVESIDERCQRRERTGSRRRMVD